MSECPSTAEISILIVVETLVIVGEIFKKYVSWNANNYLIIMLIFRIIPKNLLEFTKELYQSSK